VLEKPSQTEVLLHVRKEPPSVSVTVTTLLTLVVGVSNEKACVPVVVPVLQTAMALFIPLLELGADE
jgi:hypothetical protein